MPEHYMRDAYSVKEYMRCAANLRPEAAPSHESAEKQLANGFVEFLRGGKLLVNDFVEFSRGGKLLVNGFVEFLRGGKLLVNDFVEFRFVAF